jgi:hypothetical protein
LRGPNVVTRVAPQTTPPTVGASFGNRSTLTMILPAGAIADRRPAARRPR